MNVAKVPKCLVKLEKDIKTLLTIHHRHTQLNPSSTIIIVCTYLGSIVRLSLYFNRNITLSVLWFLFSLRWINLVHHI